MRLTLPTATDCPPAPLACPCSVMCVSFHLKQEWGGQPFFPGTGALEEIGEYQVRAVAHFTVWSHEPAVVLAS